MSIPIKLNPLGRDNQINVFQIKVKITDYSTQILNLSQSSIVTILKDWGDGTEDTKETHTYTKNGIYIVSLINVGNGLLNPFVPWRSSELVIGCNWKWNSLGDIRAIQTHTYMNNYSNWTKRVCSSVPSTLTSMTQFFGYPCNLPCYITSIPDNVTSLETCGNVNDNAIFIIDKLPSNITTLWRAFRLCNSKSRLDIGKICENAPENGFEKLTTVYGFCNGNNYDITINGTVAQFMNKCPNVTNISNNNQLETPFQGCPNIQLFGDNDHFECTVNIPEDNYTWEFTPYSSKGTWYLIQWGDSTISPTSPYKTNSCLYKFTSGTKVQHTYSKAGTYTIKLCTTTDQIVFDSVSSHNNQFQFLGNQTNVIFN